MHAEQREVVTYQFEISGDIWRQWTDLIPRSDTLADRIRDLIRQDTRARERGDSDDAVCYPLRIDPDLWQHWMDIVPESTPYHERVETLLVNDVRTAYSDGWDDMEERTARLLASRIGHRGETAKTALDDDDAEKVREEIDHMMRIADLFDE